MSQQGKQEPVAITDPVTQLDIGRQSAFQFAVDFYEADKDLTRTERESLAKTYSTISTTTLFVGWGTFFGVTSVPFVRQKLRTGATKGTNVGVAILFGMFAMMVASPIGAKKSYDHQLEKLKESNRNCYNVAKMLKPAESTKWMLYYKLTKDHPEHIMKDPRSKEAAIQRSKTIFSGRDPMGLYSGPRAEIARGPSNVPYAGEEIQINDDPFFSSDHNANSDEKDNFGGSAWQRVRKQNGINTDTSNSSAWERIRHSSENNNQNIQTQNQNPFTTNVYNPQSKIPKQPDQAEAEQNDEQREFDRLIEQERLKSTGDDENKKWG